MEFDKLKKQAYHSIALYAAVANAPRLLHVPDIVNSALDGDEEQLKLDLENVALWVVDIAFYLLSRIPESTWKDSIKNKLNNVNKVNDIIVRKSEVIDIINDIIMKLHSLGDNSIPILGKLND